MSPLSPPLQFIILLAAGWVNRRQQDVIEYLQEENRARGQQLGARRLRLSDDQRRRLAVKGKALLCCEACASVWSPLVYHE